jgi:hypothetical protein
LAAVVGAAGAAGAFVLFAVAGALAAFVPLDGGEAACFAPGCCPALPVFSLQAVNNPQEAATKSDRAKMKRS